MGLLCQAIVAVLPARLGGPDASLVSEPNAPGGAPEGRSRLGIPPRRLYWCTAMRPLRWHAGAGSVAHVPLRWSGRHGPAAPPCAPLRAPLTLRLGPPARDGKLATRSWGRCTFAAASGTPWLCPAILPAKTLPPHVARCNIVSDSLREGHLQSRLSCRPERPQGYLGSCQPSGSNFRSAPVQVDSGAASKGPAAAQAGCCMQAPRRRGAAAAATPPPPLSKGRMSASCFIAISDAQSSVNFRCPLGPAL